MSSAAVVELPPFNRCFIAPISFSNASNFAFDKCFADDDERGFLMLRNVVKDRGEGVIVREKEVETNC